MDEIYDLNKWRYVPNGLYASKNVSSPQIYMYFVCIKIAVAFLFLTSWKILLKGGTYENIFEC